MKKLTLDCIFFLNLLELDYLMPFAQWGPLLFLLESAFLTTQTQLVLMVTVLVLLTVSFASKEHCLWALGDEQGCI